MKSHSGHGMMSKNVLSICIAISLWMAAGIAADQSAEALQNGDTEESPCQNEHSKLNTEDPSPVSPGCFEVKTIYSFMTANKAFNDKGRTVSRGYRREHAFDLSVGTGIVDDLDAAVGMGYVTMRDNDTDQRSGRGFGDLDVGLRWRFLNDAQNRLEIAYLQGLTLPVGNGENERELGPGQKFWSSDQRFALSKDLDKWTFVADVGYEVPYGDKRENYRGTASTNLAVGYHVTEWLQPEAEVNLWHDFFTKEADSDAVAVTAGLIFLIGEHWKIMAGAQHVLAGRNVDRETRTIVSLTLCW